MNVLIIWCLYADFKHLGDQNHREKSCYVTSEFIALSLLVGICYSGYIQTHCQKNKSIKRTDQILPEVYGTTLNEIQGCLTDGRIVVVSFQIGLVLH